MKLFITLSKKTLSVIFALIIISFIVVGQLFTINSGGIDGSTNAKRCEYIKELGYNINETAVFSKEILIPENFSNIYARYNSIQARANFDLTPYKGEKAQIYTYMINSEEEKAINLIVADNIIIGGDVTELKVNGEINALLKG